MRYLAPVPKAALGPKKSASTGFAGDRTRVSLDRSFSWPELKLCWTNLSSWSGIETDHSSLSSLHTTRSCCLVSTSPESLWPGLDRVIPYHASTPFFLQLATFHRTGDVIRSNLLFDCQRFASRQSTGLDNHKRRNPARRPCC